MKVRNFVLVILTLMLSVGAVFAETAPKEDTGVSIFSIFKDSNEQGFFGYLILITFIIGLVYAIIRYFQLYQREKLNAANLYKSLKGYVKNDQIDEAIKITEKLKNTTLGFIFFSGLSVYRDVRKNSKGEDLNVQVQNAFDEAVLQKIHNLDSGLFWFDTLAQICTYLGLLGTIWGLIYAFQALGSKEIVDSEKNIRLSAGIKTAIGTTALGLLAAIPLTLIKGGLLTRAQRIINEIDEYSVKLINYITISNKG